MYWPVSRGTERETAEVVGQPAVLGRDEVGQRQIGTRSARARHLLAQGVEPRHASEMTREGFDLPLLIGGATTSKVHTAVKIAPNYDGPVVHVSDASRAVGVAATLASEARRQDFVRATRAEYGRIAEDRAGAGAGRSTSPPGSA